MSGISRCTVEVRNGDITRALKIFKKKVMDSGHLLELRERKNYTKPTTKRRLVKQKAIRQNQLNVMLEKYNDGEGKLQLPSKKKR
jgi:ribosomal protein S21